MPFSYLFMFSQTSKMQGAHKCHSQKKNNKKKQQNKQQQKVKSSHIYLYSAFHNTDCIKAASQ